ncbi:MAG: hypothetical protein A6F71_04950 [Cycloclasticus sp. symbiont of Poecilosclerida sp. M]|nr:MAG: hypothetical protein A6F71_04950 [Cycloclasticus sp. symbiont of Poecilosclerida sp. M]
MATAIVIYYNHMIWFEVVNHMWPFKAISCRPADATNSLWGRVAHSFYRHMCYATPKPHLHRNGIAEATPTIQGYLLIHTTISFGQQVCRDPSFLCLYLTPLASSPVLFWCAGRCPGKAHLPARQKIAKT